MEDNITVRFKTLNHKEYELTVNKKDIIESKLETIFDITKDPTKDVNFEQANIKLIYSGRILDKTKTFEDEKITDGSCIITFISKKATAPISDEDLEDPEDESTEAPATSSLPPGHTSFQFSMGTFPISGSGGQMNDIFGNLLRSLQGLAPAPPAPRRTSRTSVAAPRTTRPPASASPAMASASSIPAPVRHISMASSQETSAFWNREAEASERTALYTVEQVHAILPMIVDSVLTSQFLSNLILNRNATIGSLSGEYYRSIVRQGMEQSNKAIVGYKTNQRSDIVIDSRSHIPTTATALAPDPVPKLEDVKEDEEEFAHVEWTEQDQNNIKELQTLFPAMSEEIIKTNYIKFNKNSDATATYFLSSF